MLNSLHIEREIVPFAEVGKEIMLVFPFHGSDGAKPHIYFTAIDVPATVELRSGKGPDTDSYTHTTQITFAHKGQKLAEELPVAGAAVHDQVSVIRVLAGKVAVHVSSHTKVRTEFRTRKSP